MPYQAPTLKIKYMKPAYLEMADKGFTTPSMVSKDAGFSIVAVTGGVAAAVDSGEKLGTKVGESYVSQCGSGSY